MNGEEKKIAENILQEFAGRVEYYDLPKDLAMHTYKQSDLDRAIGRIHDNFISKAEVRKVVEQLSSGEKAAKPQGHTEEIYEFGYLNALKHLLHALHISEE